MHMPIIGGNSSERTLQLVATETDARDDPPDALTFWCADEDCPCEAGDDRIVFRIAAAEEFNSLAIEEAATAHVRDMERRELANRHQS